MYTSSGRFDILTTAKRSGGIFYFRNPAHAKQNIAVSRTAVPEMGMPTLRLATSAGCPEYGAAVVLFSLPNQESLPSYQNGGSIMNLSKIIELWENALEPLRSRHGGTFYIDAEADGVRYDVLAEGGPLYLQITHPEIIRMIESRDVGLFRVLEDIIESSFEKEKDILEVRQQQFDSQRGQRQVKVNRKAKGIVYILKGDGQPYYKIGKTTKPADRIKALNIQLPYKVEVIHVIHSDDINEIERRLHMQYAEKRGNGEWFLLTEDDVRFIKSLTSL